MDSTDTNGNGGAPESKGERTARRLREIAVEYFGRGGFRGTSVSEIARAAGLSQAAVYAYYDNKTALFDAAVDADAAEVIAYAQEQSADSDPRALVPSLLIHAAIAMEDHPLVRRVLRGEEPDALPRLINLPALAEFTRSLALEVEQGQRDGIARGDIDPETYAEGAETIILALLLGMEQLGNDIEDHRKIAVGQFFYDGLKPLKG
jgi:AcrR family transcriptional regulator